MIRTDWRIASHYVIGLAITAILLHTFYVLGLIVPVVVSGSSMRPTLHEGERLFVDRSAFLFRAPRHGELIVFRCPDRVKEFCVKRVIGLPGDRVALIEGELTLNPSQRREGGREPAAEQTTDLGDILPDGFAWARRELAAPPRIWELADHEYFVVGDNRAISEDSRNWVRPGLDAKLIVGRPLGVR